MLDQLQSVLASFQKHEVKYLVIGGIAAVLYGVPRATFEVVSLADLIASKRAAGRGVDLDDVRTLMSDNTD
jgi:hypothetical protein